MKIALIGSAPSSVALAPYNDQRYLHFIQAKPAPQYPPSLYIQDNWDIWVCSPGAYGIVPRASRWFEVHRWEPGQQWFSPEYCQFLREFNGAVYTGGPIPEIKNAVIYPYALVRKVFGTYFLNSSLSLMAAVAILEIEQIRKARAHWAGRAIAHQDGSDPEGAKTRWNECVAMLPRWTTEPQEITKTDEDDIIGYWGVDMSATEEYARQKPGCWFFIHEALRRGIGSFAPPESDLLDPEPPYGLCEWDQDYIKQTTRMREFNQRIGMANQQISQAQNELVATTGAKDALNHHIKTFMNRDRLPAGVILRLTPGEGLGPDLDTIDGKPIDEVPGPAIFQKVSQPL